MNKSRFVCRASCWSQGSKSNRTGSTYAPARRASPDRTGFAGLHRIASPEQPTYGTSRRRGEKFVGFSSPSAPEFLILSKRRNGPGLLELLDAQSPSPVPESPGHQERVIGVTFSPDSMHLVSTDMVKDRSHGTSGSPRRLSGRDSLEWAGILFRVTEGHVDDATGIATSPSSLRHRPEAHLLRGAGDDLGAIALSSVERDVPSSIAARPSLCGTWRPRSLVDLWSWPPDAAKRSLSAFSIPCR